MTKKVFMDVETSGLDPAKNQILTVALVIEDDGAVLFSQEWKIIQQAWAVMDERALMVNGINLDEHNKVAVSEGSVARDICAVIDFHGIRNGLVYGHNVAFDIGFLRSLFVRAGERFPFSYHYGDSMILAIAVSDAGIRRFASFKLVDVCAAYDLGDFIAHTALADTIASAKVYSRLIADIKGAR